MPVTHLELENFKSYAGSQRVGPFSDFTSVIGPNGAGKSNLMDAISFVLGVQSRELRSSQLKDLIFRAPGSSLDGVRCSATLVYEDDEGTETRFSRSISPSGVGDYKVNGKVMGRAAYEKELAEIGVLVKARNFLVFQGDVESLARKSPSELVDLLETISGSAEYKAAYDAAVAEKEEAEHARLFATKQKKILEIERKQLKEQKDEAERFHALLDERSQVSTELYLWQLYHLDQDRIERETIVKELASDLEEAAETEAQAASKLKAIKKAASEARRDTAAADKHRVLLATKCDEHGPNIIKMAEKMGALKKSISKDESQLETKRIDKSTHGAKLAKISDDIEEYKQTELDLVKDFEEAKSKLLEAAGEGVVQLTAAQEEEYEKVKEAAAVAGAEPRRVLAAVRLKLDSAHDAISTAKTEHSDAQKLHAKLQQEVQDLTTRHTNSTKNSETNKALLNKTEKELLSVEKVYRQNQARREELDLELEVVDAKLRDATNTSRQNNEEEKLVTALKALKSNNDGVHGRLVDLCRPTQRKYSQAVTVAAGKDMDAIVVDTKETGYRCMDYLRLQRIGVATFLPLDTIVVPQANVLDNLRARLAKDDRYRLAVDVISCSDPKMMPAVHYAVGTTVVCDDLDSARELCFGGRQSRGGLRNQDQQQPRLKAVTLGGAVISKAGTMTGGVTREDGDGAGRWKNQDMDKLRDKKKALEAERSKMDVPDDTPGKKRKFQGGHQSQIEELRNTLSSLKSKDQFFKTDLDYTKTTLKEKETQLQATAKQVGRLKKNVASAEKARDKLNAEVKKAIDKVKAAEDTHLAPFRASTGLRDLNAYEEMMGNRRDEFNKERRAVLEHISQLEQQKVFESGRDLQQPIARLEKTIKERKAELKKKEKESADLQLKADKADEQLKTAEANLKEASVKEKRFESQVATAQAAFKETQEACAKIKKQINTEEAGLERLRGRLHETLQKARVEKVELPMVGLNGEPRALGSRAQRRHRRGSDDDDDEDDESLPATSDSNGLTQTTTTQNSRGITQYSQSDNPVMVRDQQEASTVDLSQLPDSLKKRLGDREEKKLRKEFEDKLNKIAADIESITPNMKASEAFAAATQRMTESKTDLEAAKESATKAAQTFSKIKAKRTKAFMDAFNHIEEALKTIYTDMTRSSKHPLGGNAYISLDDTDEPYKGGLKFNAMPPMKRFRDMEQLSGGEKTVAALSMLFAIHSFHPAPFFVMDEVDAALDNINLRKVCNYISQRSKSDFQCIVISLKDEFYLHSQSLVGICKDVASNSSKTLTLDLTKIDESKTASSACKSSRKRSRS